MKRAQIRRLSLLAAVMVLAMLPQNLPPAIKVEPVEIREPSETQTA